MKPCIIFHPSITCCWELNCFQSDMFDPEKAEPFPSTASLSLCLWITVNHHSTTAICSFISPGFMSRKICYSMTDFSRREPWQIKTLWKTWRLRFCWPVSRRSRCWRRTTPLCPSQGSIWSSEWKPPWTDRGTCPTGSKRRDCGKHAKCLFSAWICNGMSSNANNRSRRPDWWSQTQLNRSAVQISRTSRD